jgi:hypothetical protein
MTVTPVCGKSVTVKFTVGLQQPSFDLFGQQKTRKRLFMRVFWISLDYLGHFIGGGGGNRTRVRKSSTGSSTYLAMLFNLTWHTSTGGLMTGESPIF